MNRVQEAPSKLVLFVAAAVVANALVLYLSITDHSPDYRYDLSAIERIAESGPSL